MTLSKIFEPRLVVVSETEHVIVVDDVDKQGSEPTTAQTYYKAPGRPLGFDVKNLTVYQQCSLRWPTRPPLPEIPPLEVVLNGKAQIWGCNGIQLMNGWSQRTFEVDIQLRVPGAIERDGEEKFAKEKGFQIPHGSFATFQYALVGEEDKEKKEFWLLDCWLPEQIFKDLYEAVVKERLRSLTVGVSGELLYIDDGYDPASKWTSWFLKSDRPDSGYSRGAICELAFATGGFEKTAEQTAQEVEPAGSESSSPTPVHDATYTQQIERVAMALESAQTELVRATSTIRWVVAALGIVALVLLLK